MPARHSVRALLLCSAAFSLSAPAFAQEPMIELAPITVESKREVQTDTAQSETIVDAQEIQDRQAGTMAELVDSVPGVTIVNGGSPVGTGINIRGFGANSSYGTDGKVGIQIGSSVKGGEELYRLSSQAFTDPALFRELAVTRGMGGTLQYGSGNFGGLIRLTPIQAEDILEEGDDFAVREWLEYGDNGFGYSSSTTLAWRPVENLEVLGNFTWRHIGIAEDAEGGDLAADETDLPNYLLNSRLTFGNDGEQTVSFMYMDTRSSMTDVPYNMFAAGGDIFGNVNRDIHEKTAELAYTFTSPTSDLLDLTVALSYSDQQIEQEYIPFTSAPCADGSPPMCAFLDADPRYQTTRLAVKNQALFNSGNLDHELITGLDLIRKNRTEASSSAPGGLDKRWALYAQDTIRAGGLTLTPEIRYESSKIDGGSYGDYENDGLMGGISAHYAFDSGFSLLGGAFYNQNLPIIDDLGTPGYMTQPEQATSVELGFAYDGYDLFAQGDALALKVVAYDTDIWDITSYSGVTEANLKGYEVEAAYSMEGGFYIDASTSVSKGTSDAASGFWERTPADELRLTLGRKFGDEVDLSWEIVSNAEMTRSSSPSEGYTVHNLRATLKPENPIYMGAELRLGIENLI